MRKQNLKPCICHQCGHLFYIHPTERMPLGLGRECPYGCCDCDRDAQNSEADGDCVV